MKLRALAILALVLAMTAIGAWMWSGRDGTHSDLPDSSGKPDRAEVARSPAVRDVHVPDSPATPSAKTSEPPPQAVKSAEPVRITSSVMPGMPMAQTVNAPSRRPLRVAPPSALGTVSQPDPETEGKSEVEKVQTMLRDFRTRMGENPVGSNAEIMKAVMGGNPAGARLGPPDGQGLNEKGELVDRWGTPYFFHQVSKDSMELRSAGPDRVMWTGDDLISK